MPNNDQGQQEPASDFYRSNLVLLHALLRSHPVALQYLSGRSIKYDGVCLREADRFDLPEPIGSMSTLELAHLLSIFNGSRVHQQVQKSHGPDDAPPGIYFTVVNSNILQYKNRSGIYEEVSSGAALFIHGLHIDHFFLRKDKRRGKLATIALALCAITAHLKGFAKISLTAAGGRGYGKNHVGFEVWPKLGFNASLLPGEIDAAPSLHSCETVLDIIDVEPEWWSMNGSQRLMTFDLSADSASWRKLIPYVHETVLFAGLK